VSAWPTAKHPEPRSAAGAAGAAERTRVGDRVHPLRRRTTLQNDDRRHPGRSAERHLRVRPRSQALSASGSTRHAVNH